MDFKSLDISDTLCRNLHKMGIDEPSQIQRLAIPAILAGGNFVASSQTGSGKTIAYLVPLIELITSNNDSQRAVVLTPTRELAIQVGNVCKELLQESSEECTVVYGGVEYLEQIEALKKNPSIIIATVGRLIDIIEQGVIDKPSFDYFVVDEVDQMVDMGFIEQINWLSELRKASSQTLCFSATLPTKAMEVISSLAPESNHIETPTQSIAIEKIEQQAYFVEQKMMEHLLIYLIRSDKQQKRIVFCRSRKMADKLVGILSENGFSAEAIHSDRSQRAREYILERFCSNQTDILVASDLIARGIDIDIVTEIINFGLPQDAEQYIHRIGRTGRAGRSGRAISLCCPDEKKLLESICKLMRRNIPTTTNHPYQSAELTKTLMRPKPSKRR